MHRFRIDKMFSHFPNIDLIQYTVANYSLEYAKLANINVQFELTNMMIIMMIVMMIMIITIIITIIIISIIIGAVV